MDFEVAIPSYRRAEVLRDKTLAYLAQTDLDPQRITIFVADEAERETYVAALPRAAYRDLVVAVPGMRAVRNFIQQHYAEGQPLLCLDDDLIGLSRKLDDKRLETVTDLEIVTEQAFDFCDTYHVRLWGFYPVHNPMFMKHNVTVDLRYIVGCSWGCLNARADAYAVRLDDKEDFERTMRFYLQDGGVVRLNYVAPNTNYYGTPGGMQVERTEQRVTESAQALAAEFPFLCTLNATKKSGHLELRLKDKRPKELQRYPV